MRIALLFILFCCYKTLPAQQKSDVQFKLAPSLQSTELFSTTSALFIIKVNDARQFREAIQQLHMRPEIKNYFPDYNIFVVLTSGRIIDTLRHNPSIQFIDKVRKPREEKAIKGFDGSVNKINFVHDVYPLLNGNSIVVSIKEEKPDTADIDFKGRYVETPFAATILSTHATNVATIIAGAGNTDESTRGVAWGAAITSASFNSLLPESDSSYRKFKISVQNHSYGTGIENYYGADAAAYDQSVIQKPDLLHVFSAGNAGDQSSVSGNYSGITGYANLTGSFKMGKSQLTVGSIDSFLNVSPLSSKGPAYDGRIKPELVAFGQDGSSGAAAIVSGIALLIQHAYAELNNHDLPPSDLVRAILVNSADDVDRQGIDFSSGFGNVNAYRAMHAVKAHHYTMGSVSNGSKKTFRIEVPAGSAQLKVTLCWNDLPANPNAKKSLIQDLDLSLQNITTNQQWLPWVLNSSPYLDSLIQLPSRKKDTLNTIEQITIVNPASGTYEIGISGTRLVADQLFAITWQLDSLSTFQWTYPTKSDPLLPSQEHVLRWENFSGTEHGLLEYSLKGGAEWSPISNNVNLSVPWIKFRVPDTVTTILFRMAVNTSSFTSDTTVVAARPFLHVAYVCADSALLYWNRHGINDFVLYKLGEKYLEPKGNTTDTTFTVRAISGSNYFAVAPVVAAGKQGLRSYAIDLNNQGAGCYVRTFLVDKFDDFARLQIELGTLTTVRSVEVQKLTGNIFVTRYHTIPSSALFFWNDSALQKGVNAYRLKVSLDDGQILYSRIESVIHFPDYEFIIFPNPATSSGGITIAARNPEEMKFQLFNTMGKLIIEIGITDISNHISLNKTGSGIFFYRIVQKGVTTGKGQLLITR